MSLDPITERIEQIKRDMKGRALTKPEREFQDKVCQLGCIVCRLFLGMDSPCSFHHIDGRTKEGAHFHGFGLCGRHHQIPDTDKPPRWHTRHPNKIDFENEYGTEQELYHKMLELLDEREPRANHSY